MKTADDDERRNVTALTSIGPSGCAARSRAAAATRPRHGGRAVTRTNAPTMASTDWLLVFRYGRVRCSPSTVPYTRPTIRPTPSAMTCRCRRRISRPQYGRRAGCRLARRCAPARVMPQQQSGDPREDVRGGRAMVPPVGPPTARRLPLPRSVRCESIHRHSAPRSRICRERLAVGVAADVRFGIPIAMASAPSGRPPRANQPRHQAAERENRRARRALAPRTQRGLAPPPRSRSRAASAARP